ncbi:histidine kinase dimerization/phospho-acceptor domain-containing protein [Massilia sp. CFBP9012]|nr:histidine kinase dimerization/phospho-acceptor domain-containing protein [Massilia sp. CFBP9012]MDY0975185.1 histidine kinase dimerization/phospho-acceptor domain-containing protein [Massilia sp. CFBP9012]
MNILLVEDDAMLAAAIRERARQEGLVLDHAGDAESARLALLDNVYSVILLDLGLALAFCWICGGGVVVAYTASNEHSLWDGKLQSFGTRLLLSLPAEEINEGPFGPNLELPPEMQRDPENFAIQVWSHDRRLMIRSPAAPAKPFQPTFHNGFASVDASGQTWRVYTISDRDGLVSVQVANLQGVIDREMYGETLTALAAMTAVLVLVALLLLHALDRSLRPLSMIERALLRRKDFDLTPLPVAALPIELRPLVTSFNHLLVQLDKAVANERRFLGDAAHELRTPLSVLQAHVDVALHARSDAEREEALQMLQQGVRRSARMAEQLLDVARLDAMSCSISTEALDLAVLVEHVVHEYAYHVQHLGCTLVCEKAPAWVEGNLDELATLLRNLLDNAVRFARDSGRVEVACGEGPRWTVAERRRRRPRRAGGRARRHLPALLPPSRQPGPRQRQRPVAGGGHRPPARCAHRDRGWPGGKRLCGAHSLPCPCRQNAYR